MTHLPSNDKMDCLLHGYCRKLFIDALIPTDVIKTCLSFYDTNIYLSLSKQDINQIITDFSLDPISTQIHTINGFNFKLTAIIHTDHYALSESEYDKLDEMERKYDYDDQLHFHELQINMIFTKLPSTTSKQFFIIKSYETRMDDEIFQNSKKCQSFNAYYDKWDDYVYDHVHDPEVEVATMHISNLSNVKSVEFVFDFDIVDKFAINQSFKDVGFEWVLDKKTLNLISSTDKTYIYSPEGFGLNKMFNLRIDCIEDKLDLYLFIKDPMDIPGTLRIERVKVMLAPFDKIEKRKVWRARDTKLDIKSKFLVDRGKRWKFDKKQMIEYFLTHSLLIELKGLYLD